MNIQELLKEIGHHPLIHEYKRMEAMQYAMTYYNKLPKINSCNPESTKLLCIKTEKVYEETLARYIK